MLVRAEGLLCGVGAADEGQNCNTSWRGGLDCSQLIDRNLTPQEKAELKESVSYKENQDLDLCHPTSSENPTLCFYLPELPPIPLHNPALRREFEEAARAVGIELYGQTRGITFGGTDDQAPERSLPPRGKR